MKKLRLPFYMLLLLFIPHIAMQFTDEVKWNIGDFFIAGLMLFGIGFLIDLVTRKIEKKRYRIPIIIGIVMVFVLIWMELSVGIFNSPLAGN